jgi:hypothetical protein
MRSGCRPTGRRPPTYGTADRPKAATVKAGDVLL